MTFYVALRDVAESSIMRVYANNRLGFGAKRIPRKAKKALLREWRMWRADPATVAEAEENMRRCAEKR